jgi:hypothetical protein
MGMTKYEREFHERMNTEIAEAIEGLLASFDITSRDLGKDGQAQIQFIRGELKDTLFKAYLVNHSID